MPADSPIVIATFSRRMRLKLPDGQLVNARIKGKRLRPVCGDRVVAEPIESEEDWLITAINDRDNELSRPNQRGQTEVLAANVDLVVVVAAATPKPDWFIVDRYLSATENMGVTGAVVYNKIDLEPDPSDATEVLQEYEVIGYPTLRCSAKSGASLDSLQTLLAGKTAIIVGQSGVGKSSLINYLVDSADLATAAISEKRGEGRHTTVNSMMLELPGGGSVIDSPGVRDYAPALLSAEQVGRGFREIEATRMRCRFANCRHTREPGCAVKKDVEQGRISARRYESYKRLLNLTDRLARNT